MSRTTHKHWSQTSGSPASAASTSPTTASSVTPASLRASHQSSQFSHLLGTNSLDGGTVLGSQQAFGG